MDDLPDGGFSVGQAFRHFADPKLLARYDELAPDHRDTLRADTQHLHQECRNLLYAIYDAMIARLKRGELVAYAIDAHGPVTQGYVRVEPAWWRRLEFDYDFEDVRGENDIHLTEVLIFEADAEASRSGERGPDPRTSEEKRTADGKPRIELTNRYSLLVIGDEVFVFRGDKRKEIVRKLVDAYHRGERLLTKELLGDAGSDTLKKLLKGGRSAAMLTRILRQENGYCWLEP